MKDRDTLIDSIKTADERTVTMADLQTTGDWIGFGELMIEYLSSPSDGHCPLNMEWLETFKECKSSVIIAPGEDCITISYPNVPGESICEEPDGMDGGSIPYDAFDTFHLHVINELLGAPHSDAAKATPSH